MVSLLSQQDFLSKLKRMWNQSGEAPESSETFDEETEEVGKTEVGMHLSRSACMLSKPSCERIACVNVIFCSCLHSCKS